jgi:hypothetical protein
METFAEKIRKAAEQEDFYWADIQVQEFMEAAQKQAHVVSRIANNLAWAQGRWQGELRNGR